MTDVLGTRGRHLLATVVMGAMAVAGCGAQRSDAARPEASASASAEARVRHDKQPVRVRFPQLGDFERVAWSASPLGEADARVPGPTDVRMSGIVWLTAADAASLRSAYAWRTANAGPDVLDGLSAHVPDDVSWQVTAVYAESAEGAAVFHADFDRKVVVFDAVNPPRAVE